MIIISEQKCQSQKETLSPNDVKEALNQTKLTVYLFSTRIAQVRIGQKIKEQRKSRLGKASLLLGSLVVVQIISELTKAGISWQDYTKISKGKLEKTLCDIIKPGLNCTKRSCQGLGLKINPSIIKTRKRINNLKTVIIDKSTVEWKPEVKLILLHIKHEKETLNKAIKALMIKAYRK